MIPVYLEHARDYDHAALRVHQLLECVMPPLRGRRVLLKPNFVALRDAAHACTHPAIIHAAAVFCLEHGARVVVGDAPAFGQAESIAHRLGAAALLAPLGVPTITLRRRVTRIWNGQRIVLSQDALEADVLLNLPKCKAHAQMRYTGAVKNLFGCVPGVRKAWLHATHGDRGSRFSDLIAALGAMLPPSVHLIDGVVAMHRSGPIHGEPYPLGLLGASADAAAVDTALALVLGAGPEQLPIWQACLRAGHPGAQPAELEFPWKSPDDFPCADFELPHALKPESFRPTTLAWSSLKRVWQSVFSRGFFES